MGGPAAVREWYEEVWEELPPGLTPPQLELRAAFLRDDIAPGERVLDLGCGEGRLTAIAAEHGAEVVGADVAEAALRRAREAHPGIRFELVPPHGPFPFADAAFDAVWASDVIEHVADTEQWVNEVRRVLAPGGRLLVTTPSVGPLRRALSPPDPRGQHLRFYTRRSLRSLLQDMGFHPVAVRRRRGQLLARAVR
jgi:SAM-dependent methyltransferase